jgi:hypothetical protein
MSAFFHVTSDLNRDSISAHGLDWRHMGASAGIAGSSSPEVEGVYLCQAAGQVEVFLMLNNTGTAADVWAVDGVDLADLIDNGTGFLYLPKPVPASKLTLQRRSVPKIAPPGSL